MSQFRTTGTRYISQWGGDDLNVGTDPLFPRKTIAAVTTSQILGTGYYTLGNLTSRTLIGDGKVVLYPTGGNSWTLVNINWRGGTSTGGEYTLTDCVVDGGISGIVGMRGAKTRNVFIGVLQLASVATNGFAFSNNIFAQDPLSPLPTYITLGAKSYNFVARGARFRFSAADLALHVNNMCNGLLQLTTSLSTDWYEAKLLIDGSPRPDADPLFPDIVTVFPDFYTQGNFAGDAKMIDFVSKTVEPDSDLLKKQSANGYIGGVKPAKFVRFDDVDWTISMVDIDTINPNFVKVVDGEPYGVIRFTGRVSDNLISSQRLFVRSPFLFDGDEAGGSALNNNASDSFTRSYGPDVKGYLPNRLTTWVRSSRLSVADPDVDADWDNDDAVNPSIAGRYYLQEYGERLMHHIIATTVYGNADANAINALTKVGFNYRSLDIIAILSQDRVI